MVLRLFQVPSRICRICIQEHLQVFLHRIQGRSPFVQTFVVELSGVAQGNPIAGYLPTERAAKNRGYSATLNQCPVSSKGGQELVDATVKGLKELYK